ncbi:hypothetical protein [Oecophyllibacter saccharovorans]|uniref:hypothetical protein n=1 Tax=Oecophyllibacter saccharovorans TaxID=2558360 RepID=UPI001167FFB8|nr:hypothetical protein [Oecophyllibacter saccharovorans]TPW34909.1 hypothetical protein E3203_05230 [Oecophyllibacter saccharovorans]
MPEAALFPTPWVITPDRAAFQAAFTRFGPRGFTAISPLFGGCAFGLTWWQDVTKGDILPPTLLDCGEAAAMALYYLQHSSPSQGVICRNLAPSLLHALPLALKHRLFTAYPAEAQMSTSPTRREQEKAHDCC